MPLRDKCPRGHDNTQPSQRTKTGYCKRCHYEAQSKYEVSPKGRTVMARYRSRAKWAKVRFYADLRDASQRHKENA